jgi:hypothetical protein
MNQKTWTKTIVLFVCGLLGVDAGGLALLGVLALGFGVAWPMGACGASTPSTSSGSGGSGGSACSAQSNDPPDDDETMGTCSAPDDACWRYKILLVGDPNTHLDLRDAYTAAFGDACYVSVSNTFDCFYKTWQAACADAALIGEVSGNAPYDKGYTCQPDGVGNYTLQNGPDPALVTYITYYAAPRQTPLVEVNGVQTEVNGPYRNLPEPQTIEPGMDFYCPNGMIGADGFPIAQRSWILKVNRDRHGGEVHSDLAGFKWLCKSLNEKCEVVIETCEEQEVLIDPDVKDGGVAGDGGDLFKYDLMAQVHHVVPVKDKRSCPWGTNTNKNAAVISQKLNRHLTNNNPPAEEIEMLNSAMPY